MPQRKEKKHPQLHKNEKEMHFVNLSLYFQVNLELEPRKLPQATQNTR